MHDICPVCSHIDETGLHVSVARDWRKILASIELDCGLRSIDDLIYLVRSLKGKRGSEARWKQVVVMYTAWLIWN